MRGAHRRPVAPVTVESTRGYGQKRKPHTSTRGVSLSNDADILDLGGSPGVAAWSVAGVFASRCDKYRECRSKQSTG
jgi:hypothetical protein